MIVAGLLVLPQAKGLADQPKQAVEQAVDSDGIQREAPLPERARKSINEAESQPDIQRTPPENKPLPPPPSIPHLNLDLHWLPYAILAVIVIGILVIAARYLRFRLGLNPADRDRRAAPETISYALTPAAEERDHTFDEIDALAAQGAFTEAVHRLLLLVQERLRDRIEHGLQASLTSREILRRAKLPTDASTAFATLVAAVEISLFGEQAANETTYHLCRENSRRVLAATTA